MNPLTTQDIAAGWFLIGAVCALAGIGVIALVRSAWSEKRARKAERTMTDWPETARIVADTDRDYRDSWPFFPTEDESIGLVDTRLADHTAQFERRLSPVAPVVRIPRQRGGQ